MLFNLNGKLLGEDEARISVLDRGFLYGDGIYETVLIRNRRPFHLGKHLARLRSSASIVRLDLNWTDEKMEIEVNRLLEAGELRDAALRINVSRGVGDWRLSTGGALNPTILLSLFPIPEYPQDTYSRGWDVVISRDVVTMDPVIPAVAKTTNRLNLILAKREAEERGAKEAVLLNMQGFLTEGTSSNIFFVMNGEVCTPSLESGILEGVTRGIVIDILRGEGIDTKESLYSPEDLKSAEESFLTFTTAGVVPIHAVDGQVIGEEGAGSLTGEVIASYEKEVEQLTAPHGAGGVG
jgi:branched-chain amino acid aminotransferase